MDQWTSGPKSVYKCALEKATFVNVLQKINILVEVSKKGGRQGIGTCRDCSTHDMCGKINYYVLTSTHIICFVLGLVLVLCTKE